MSGLRVSRKILGGTALILALSGCATVPASGPAGVLSLGNNASGERCTATQNWNDPALPEFVKNPDVYSVNCTGPVTSALARVRLFSTASARDEASAGLQCGAASPVTLDGFDRASARRCFDPALGFATVVVDADKAGTLVQISSAASAIGAGYQAALLLTGQSADAGVNSARTPINLATLADLPTSMADATQGSGGQAETADTLLSRATELNFRGLSADASRLLRDEINRLPAGTSAVDRAQLLLEAGLADSNIRFFRSAGTNLDLAEAVIQGLSGAKQRELRTQLNTYRGLHALNQRDFAAARGVLSPLAEQAEARMQDLNDPATLAQLNSVLTDKTDIRSAIALPNLDLFRETVIGVQGTWALSVAELSLGNPAAALVAIDQASSELGELNKSLDGQRIERGGLYWLEAKLTRQRGRIQAESGNYTDAVTSYEAAITTLEANARAFAPSDPAIAELRLERASVIDRAGKPQAEVEAAYNLAIDAMLNAREASAGFSTGLLHPFLDDLAGRMARGDKAAANRYFDALQVAGESSAARQVSQLQEIVSGDPVVAGKLRERQDLRGRLIDLDGKIADARNLGLSDAALVTQRNDVFRLLDEAEATLAGDSRLAQISDRPADLAALQAKLKPGEGYVRLTVMNDRVFGILVDSENAYPIRPTLASSDVLGLATALRRSADPGDDGVIPEFSVQLAVALYQALFADVDPQVRAKSELVFDGGSVLSGLPAALLVTDPASAATFAQQENKYDYSKIAFLSKLMPTSVAMSPRSFIASREFTKTRAKQPLIGFAAPESIGQQPIGSGGKFRIGPCLVDAAAFAQYNNLFAPIAADEIYYAAQALGLDGDPRVITGAQFSDTEMARLGQAGGDLLDYKVLHFATHGLTEGQFDCSGAPAALLTSYGGSAASDLLLSYDEIARLRLDANLVVLSACDTASQVGEAAQIRAGEAQPGSTLDGLVRAFVAAGSRAVMATYWEAANTDAATLMMSEFYAAGRNQSIASALNQAQRSMIDYPETSHPFFWASYFVVGDTGNQMLDGATKVVAAR